MHAGECTPTMCQDCVYNSVSSQFKVTPSTYRICFAEYATVSGQPTEPRRRKSVPVRLEWEASTAPLSPLPPCRSFDSSCHASFCTSVLSLCMGRRHSGLRRFRLQSGLPTLVLGRRRHPRQQTTGPVSGIRPSVALSFSKLPCLTE